MATFACPAQSSGCVQEAVFRAIYAEMNARLQLEAETLWEKAALCGR